MKKGKLGFVVCGVLLVTLLFSQAVLAIQWDKFKGTELKVLSVRQPYQEGVLMFLREFEKMTGMKVSWDFVPWPSLRQITSIELASGLSAYDLIFTGGGHVARFAAAGWIHPVDRYLSDPTLTDAAYLDIDDIFAAALEQMSYEGKLYGLPHFNATQNLYYNLEVFREKGIAKAPETFDEFIEVATKVHTERMPAVSLRARPGSNFNIWTWLSFFYGQGARVYKDFPRDMHPTLDTPQAIEAAKKYAHLCRDYGPPGFGTIGFPDNVANFQTARVVMTVEGSPLAGTIMDPDKCKVIGKVGFALIPSKGPGGHFPPFTAQGWFIPEGSNHKEAAWLTMQWMTSAPTVKKIALNTNFTAVARRSVFEDPEFIAKYDYDFGGGSFLNVYKRTIEIAPFWYLPNNPEWPEIGDILGNALNSVIVGAEEAEVALKKAQEEAYKVLEKAGYFKK